MSPTSFVAWTKGQGTPHVLITAGVHGDEFTPIAAARALIRRLETTEIRGRVTIVPIVNEPAFRLGLRVADDGLDLARTCPGRPDGSVTEVIAHDLATLIRTADLYIDLHSGGVRLDILPLVGYMLHPDEHVLNRQRTMALAFGMPLVWGTDPNLDGRSLSVARDANIPAIYAEYGGGAAPEAEAVEAYVVGCWNVLATAGAIGGGPAAIGSPLVVEDARPNAGHLQIQHPSPRPGFFEPTVALGDRVRDGDVLGHVSGPLGLDPEPLVAARSGLVIALHAFSSVGRGDGLAVVLETDLDRPHGQVFPDGHLADGTPIR